MENSFKGKRALVTGAGKGIGRAIAIALMKSGAETYAISRTQEDLSTLSLEVPGIKTIKLDISNWEETENVIKGLGVIELLVNNAGTNSLSRFLEVKQKEIDKLFDVNYKAVLNISQVVCRELVRMKMPGSIVNVSSRASQIALHDHVVYCSSKAALDALTKVMSLELGPHLIRVNSVNPTVCLTDLGLQAWGDPAKAKPMLERIPLGRFLEVHEVVDAVLFLLSDKASAITGQYLFIDGGSSVN